MTWSKAFNLYVPKYHMENPEIFLNKLKESRIKFYIEKSLFD